jgi:hypothetical protein
MQPTRKCKSGDVEFDLYVLIDGDNKNTFCCFIFIQYPDRFEGYTVEVDDLDEAYYSLDYEGLCCFNLVENFVAEGRVLLNHSPMSGIASSAVISLMSYKGLYDGSMGYNRSTTLNLSIPEYLEGVSKVTLLDLLKLKE